MEASFGVWNTSKINNEESLSAWIFFSLLCAWRRLPGAASAAPFLCTWSASTWRGDNQEGFGRAHIRGFNPRFLWRLPTSSTSSNGYFRSSLCESGSAPASGGSPPSRPGCAVLALPRNRFCDTRREEMKQWTAGSVGSRLLSPEAAEANPKRCLCLMVARQHLGAPGTDGTQTRPQQWLGLSWPQFYLAQLGLVQGRSLHPPQLCRRMPVGELLHFYS